MYTYYDVAAPSTTYTATGSISDGAAIWLGVAACIAFVCGILVYFLFVKPTTEPKGKFAKWLKDFLSFKIMWIEPILKIAYYIATIFVILFSFTFLSQGGNGVLMWLICFVLGPIMTRLTYEIFMMFIMIWRNTRDISESVSKKK